MDVCWVCELVCLCVVCVSWCKGLMWPPPAGYECHLKHEEVCLGKNEVRSY